MPGEDFSTLEAMTYSGRGIVVGRTPSDKPFIGYTLTGRSPSSQARRLVYDEDHEVIRTNVTNAEILARGNAALLIYPAIMCDSGFLMGSNGAQSELIYNARHLSTDKSPRGILQKAFHYGHCQFNPKNGWVNITGLEPDAPNYTPRISAVVNGNQGGLHIIRNGQKDLETRYFQFELKPGTGKMITTYDGGNENPLKHFQGDPFDVTITRGTARKIVHDLYRSIESTEDNFAVAAAVMLLDGDQVRVERENRFE